MSVDPHFQRVALIGFGLIGGSIARAAKLQGLAGEIVTTARSEKTRARVLELGIVDKVVATNVEAVKDADLVILCIPVGACGPVAQEIAAHLKPGAVISDVGSVKGAVVKDSILMQAVSIGENCHLDHVILDKGVVIRDGRVLTGYDGFPIILKKGTTI